MRDAMFSLRTRDTSFVITSDVNANDTKASMLRGLLIYSEKSGSVKKKSRQVAERAAVNKHDKKSPVSDCSTTRNRYSDIADARFMPVWKANAVRRITPTLPNATCWRNDVRARRYVLFRINSHLV